MFLDNLKTGMVVETNNHKLYLVIRNVEFTDGCDDAEDIFVSESGWNRFNDFTTHMKERYGDTPYDILKVYQPRNSYAITTFLKNKKINEEEFDLIYERF